MNNNHQEILGEYRQLIENQLDRFLTEQLRLEQSIIIEAMRYSLLGGGKRIRAILTLEVCNALTGDYKKAIIPACALEMVHAYSLIHDDLPCMDDDNMRRGKPTSHIKFGEDIAVLAGDGLLTLAFEILSSENAVDILTAQKAIECTRALSTGCGEYGMIGGQVLDMQGEGRKMSCEQLSKMVSLKTGALIKTAVHCGCIVADATKEQTDIALDFAELLGVAFQMIDDMLDVTADEQMLGKPIKSDLKNEKSTYVSVFGIEETKRLINQHHEEADVLLKKLNGDCSLLSYLTNSLAKRMF